MDLAAAFRAFAAVFPAELPDKTMVAILVLVAHHRRPLLVWCGAAGAFAVHVVVAVTAGQLLGKLPDALVSLLTAVLFGVGAVLLLRASRSSESETGELDDAPANGTARTALLSSFGIIIIAEWGDLTQLATAGMAASSGSPVAVGVGALAALWAVAALGAVFGRTLLARLPVSLVQRCAAVIFALVAVWSLAQLA